MGRSAFQVAAGDGFAINGDRGAEVRVQASGRDKCLVPLTDSQPHTAKSAAAVAKANFAALTIDDDRHLLPDADDVEVLVVHVADLLESAILRCLIAAGGGDMVNCCVI